jgi:hypothetical protein
MESRCGLVSHSEEVIDRQLHPGNPTVDWFHTVKNEVYRQLQPWNPAVDWFHTVKKWSIDSCTPGIPLWMGFTQWRSDPSTVANRGTDFKHRRSGWCGGRPRRLVLNRETDSIGFKKRPSVPRSIKCEKPRRLVSNTEGAMDWYNARRDRVDSVEVCAGRGTVIVGENEKFRMWFLQWIRGMRKKEWYRYMQFFESYRVV